MASFPRAEDRRTEEAHSSRKRPKAPVGHGYLSPSFSKLIRELTSFQGPCRAECLQRGKELGHRNRRAHKGAATARKRFRARGTLAPHYT